MASNPTYGVDADELQAYLPAVPMGGANNLHTPARIATLVKHAATRFNRALVAAGGNPSDVDDEPDSLAYGVAQGIICQIVAARILEGLHHGSTDESKDLHDRAQDELARLHANPAFFAARDETPIQPQVWTATDAMGLATDDASRAARRQWDNPQW